MDWRELLTFEGRLSRLAFWRRILLIQALGACGWLAGLFAVLWVGKIGAILFAVFLPLVGAYLATGVRRLHDIGQPGLMLVMLWGGPWALLAAGAGASEARVAFAPWIELVLALGAVGINMAGLWMLGARRGDADPNRYG